MKNIFILFVLTLFLNGCLQPAKNSSFEQSNNTAKDCLKNNGDWIPLKQLYANRNLNSDDEGRYICHIRTTDSGKKCNDNAQCQGSCQAPTNAISGLEAKGICSAHIRQPNDILTMSEGKVTYLNISKRNYPAKSERLKTLQLNREKWLSYKIANYQIILTKSCYCSYGPYYGPNKIIVRNNKIKSVIYRGERRDGIRYGDELIKEQALKKTIPDMFDYTERTIKNATENATLNIEYDETYGFPTIVDFDRPDWSHSESKIVVSNFRYRK